MRQLKAVGFMHNRVRMVTASFLVKDLHQDWRRGADYFMSQLLDGDVASNYLNWQWVAGTELTATLMRILNPLHKLNDSMVRASTSRNGYPNYRT